MFSFCHNYESWLRACLHTGPCCTDVQQKHEWWSAGNRLINAMFAVSYCHDLIFMITRKIQAVSLVIALIYSPQFQEQGPSRPGGWCCKEEHFCCISPDVYFSLSWVSDLPGLWLFGDWRIWAFWLTRRLPAETLSSAHHHFYQLRVSGLVWASFPPFPTKTYFRIRRLQWSPRSHSHSFFGSKSLQH